MSDLKSCGNCDHAIRIYNNGKVVAIICDIDIDDIKERKMLPQNLLSEKACSYWKGDE